MDQLSQVSHLFPRFPPIPPFFEPLLASCTSVPLHKSDVRVRHQASFLAFPALPAAVTGFAGPAPAPVVP